MANKKRFRLGDIIEPKMPDFEGLLIVKSHEYLHDNAMYITGENDMVRRRIYCTDYYNKVGNVFEKENKQ